MHHNIQPIETALPDQHLSCSELNGTACLILWTMRRLVRSGLSDAAAVEDFSGAFGEGHARPLILLRTMIAHIAMTGRRKVNMGMPCRPCLTRDELGMLVAVDAAAHGDFVRAHGIFADMVRIEHVDQLTHIAEALGEAMAEVGRPLRMLERIGAPPATRH